MSNMMKKSLNILVVLATMAVALNMASCSDDELGATIFDTNEYPLDRHAYTFPLDTFIKKNFLEQYNMRYIYRMQYISSDKDKNLTPATYENSCKLAVLTKYLWYDVYDDVAAGKSEFLKEYSPRIIHVIGSKNLNTSSGTETLGVTEGGTKVTLYRVNLLDPNDIDNMNEYFFETMHHEFGHILDNNHLHPTPFNLLSNGLYDPAGWSDTPDSVAASKGFFSNYASSSYTEDWVETLGRYITRDSIALENMYNTAEYDWEIVSLTDQNGDDEVSELDYKYLVRGTVDIDTIGYFKEDKSGKDEHKIYRRVCERDNHDYVVKYESLVDQQALTGASAADIEVSDEVKSGTDVMSATFTANAKDAYCISLTDIDASKYDVLEIKLSEPAKGQWKVTYQLDAGKVQNVNFGTASSFTLDLREASELKMLKLIADKGVTETEDLSATNQAVIKIDHVKLIKYQPKWKTNTLGAKQILENKLQFVREYMQSEFGIDLDQLRYEIQRKQFRKGADGKFITTTYYNTTNKRNEQRLENAITYVDPATGKSVLDLLLEDLNKYKALQK